MKMANVEWILITQALSAIKQFKVSAPETLEITI